MDNKNRSYSIFVSDKQRSQNITKDDGQCRVVELIFAWLHNQFLVIFGYKFTNIILISFDYLTKTTEMYIKEAHLSYIKGETIIKMAPRRSITTHTPRRSP